MLSAPVFGLLHIYIVAEWLGVAMIVRRVAFKINLTIGGRWIWNYFNVIKGGGGLGGKYKMKEL